VYIVITIVHIIACFLLISVILLQAGRGGGLSDMFGGGMQQSQKLFGTETNVFMTKATTVCAILFVITCITLGIMTTSRSRSLVTPSRLEPLFGTTATPEEGAPAPEVPATEALFEETQGTSEGRAPVPDVSPFQAEFPE